MELLLPTFLEILHKITFIFLPIRFFCFSFVYNSANMVSFSRSFWKSRFSVFHRIRIKSHSFCDIFDFYTLFFAFCIFITLCKMTGFSCPRWTVKSVICILVEYTCISLKEFLLNCPWKKSDVGKNIKKPQFGHKIFCVLQICFDFCVIPSNKWKFCILNFHFLQEFSI